MKNKVTIIDSGICICKTEPRGEYGLEGFVLNTIYKYIICKQPFQKVKQKYYRIYLTEDYYETCSVTTFNNYFKIKTKNLFTYEYKEESHKYTEEITVEPIPGNDCKKCYYHNYQTSYVSSDPCLVCKTYTVPVIFKKQVILKRVK